MEKQFTEASLIKHIRQKQQVLKRVSKELKAHFVGIDHIIDKIIKAVEVWYILPQLLTRPSIICLWGPTGVGKTDLVRRFVKAIKFFDRFCEIELSSKGAYSWHTTISSILSQDHSMESGTQSILLFDEIQNFRTLDETGVEITDYHFKDIWSLLSDGKLPYKPDMDYLLSIIYDDERRKKRQKERKKTKKIVVPTKQIAETYKYDYDDSTTQTPQVTEVSINNDRLLKEIFNADPGDDDEEDDHSFFSSHYHNIKRFKSLLRLPESIEEIANWSEDKKRSVLLNRLNDKALYEEENYCQSLIFISGNLDEAYQFGKRAEDVDTEADTYHEWSKKITIIDIKNALKLRFKPEQIARFGNTHMIYPSLSKSSYEKIIHRKIVEIEKRTFDNFGIKVHIDKSIEALIYSNGVFPTQGTRPVFSTISEILEAQLPTILMQSMIKRIREVEVKYENQKIIAESVKNTLINSIPYDGTIDKLRGFKNKNLDRKTMSAVHESGHAVIYALLTGIAPPEFVVTPATDEVEGYVLLHNICGSKVSILDKICVSLAGSEAEKVVFGDNYFTSGGISDLNYATTMVGEMVRSYGMDKFSSSILTEFNQRANHLNNDLKDSNTRIESIIKEQREITRKLLLDNVVLFKSVVDTLLTLNKITPDEFVKLCKKAKLSIKVIANSTEIIYPNYLGMYNKFKESK